MNNASMQQLVRHAWNDVPPAPKQHLVILEQGWGAATAAAFLGVRPMEVDTRSPGFHAATPLLDLPATAAATYLGTFLLALLQSLEFQDAVGLFDDFLTRAHVLTVLTSTRPMGQIVENLSKEQRDALRTVATYLARQQRDALDLDDRQVELLLSLSNSM